MKTQTTKTYFSEMAERTEATAWEDRLLRANVLTVSKCPVPPKFDWDKNVIKNLEYAITESFRMNPYVMSSKEDLLSFTEYMGGELQEEKYCFDMFVRVLYDNAQRAGLNENGLKRKLQETLLKRLEASIK